MVASTAGSQSPRANRSEPILIVEYDRQSTRLLDSLLLQVSSDLLVVRSGLAALDAIVGGTFGLVIIGIELPDMTTLELLRHLRQVSDVPIIVVAREYEAETLVRSLDGGADDYIARPYPPMELAARVRAVLRRARPRTPEPEPYIDDQIRIDFRTNMVTTSRGSIALSATERSLLSELVANEGCVVTHSELAVRIWGEEYRGRRRTCTCSLASCATRWSPTRPAPSTCTLTEVSDTRSPLLNGRPHPHRQPSRRPWRRSCSGWTARRRRRSRRRWTATGRRCRSGVRRCDPLSIQVPALGRSPPAAQRKRV